MIGWHSSIGLYPGRVCFAFPEDSRHVYLNTNTLPMMKVCPNAKGFNTDIFSIQGDTGVQNHWVYEREDDINPFAFRLANFLRHYDGVHNLLQNRDEINMYYAPDLHETHPVKPIGADYRPAHYYHNWRFNNIYNAEKK